MIRNDHDRCLRQVWDLTVTGTDPHIPHKAAYTLHPAFPVRRVLWRPSYECEVAIVSNEEFGTGSNHELPHSTTLNQSQPQRTSALFNEEGGKNVIENKSPGSHAVEIWDVRREWIAKWSVTGSALEGGASGELDYQYRKLRYSYSSEDMAFADSHAAWVQHTSGMFSQIDLRDCTKPIDAISRVAVSWEASGTLAFVADRPTSCEMPYDDM